MTKYPGLYNSICKKPKYYCSSKKVFLEERHVKKKKCLCKPTMDMISTHKCPNLLTVEEYENQKKEIKERLELAKNNYKAEKNYYN